MALPLLSVFQNPREHRVDSILLEVAEANGDRLLVKPRVADLIDTDKLRVANSVVHRYSLQAHFDFALVDWKTGVPRMVVELDGRQHVEDLKVQQRDRQKNWLCGEANLPLVRVNNDFARRSGDYTVLSYICDIFYKSQAWDTAYDAGNVPRDDSFNHGMFLRTEPDGGVFFDTFDAKARHSLLNLWKAGKIPRFLPDEWTARDRESGDVVSEQYLLVAKDRVLVGHATVRPFAFTGFSAYLLAPEVAAVEVAWLANGWLRGQPTAMSTGDFQAHFRQFQRMNPRAHAGQAGSNERSVPYPDGLIPFPA